MVLIKNLKNYRDQEVEIKGWVYNFRSSGKISFLQLRDGSGFVQAIAVKSEVGDQVWQNIEKMTIESSVAIKGQVTEHPKQPGVFELQVKDLEIINLSAEYPIGKKEHGPEFLLDNRHLWLRSSKQWATLRIRDEIFFALTSFLKKENFTRVDAPILQPTSCEDTSELFEIDYFGDSAYLTQSGQLYIEAAEMSLGRVYDFGPVFRAEKSKTRKHLTEFWMMDAELPFEALEEMIEFIEKMIKYLVSEVLKNKAPELKILERDLAPLENIIKRDFIKLTHRETIELLNEKFLARLTLLDDIGAPEEAMLAELYDVPVFVKDWPAEIKAFYMPHFDDGKMKRVRAVDLICSEGYGEIVGGAEREWDYKKILAVMKERGYKLEDYQWYLDLRKYGSIPHSGFGLGLERLVAWICGLKHVREAIPFPRLINRLRP